MSCGRLSALFATGGAFQELWPGDGAALMEMVNGLPMPVPKVHFGYVDGIADLTIKGGPEGNMHCFLPSITALKFIAGLK